MEDNYLGRLIRDSRKMKGLTQEALANAAGVSTMSIRRYESGERKPTAEIMLRIMDAIGEPYTIVSNSMLDEIAEEKKNDALSSLLENDRKRRELLRIAELKEGIGEENINAFINSEIGLSMILFTIDLNDEGQLEAVKRIEQMTRLDEYQRTALSKTPTEPLAEDGQGNPSTEQEKPSDGLKKPTDGNNGS